MPCVCHSSSSSGQGSQAAPLLVLGGGGTPLFIWGEAPGFALCTVRLILLSDPKRWPTFESRTHGRHAWTVKSCSWWLRAVQGSGQWVVALASCLVGAAGSAPRYPDLGSVWRKGGGKNWTRRCIFSAGSTGWSQSKGVLFLLGGLGPARVRRVRGLPRATPEPLPACLSRQRPLRPGDDGRGPGHPVVCFPSGWDDGTGRRIQCFCKLCRLFP